MHGYHTLVLSLRTHRNSNPRNAKTALSSVIVTIRVFSVFSRLDLLERLSVGARGSAISLGLQVRGFEGVQLHDVDEQSPKAMRRGGFRPLAYLRSKLLQTNGGLCHPAPASPLAPNASGRAPSLDGHYPASSLLRTHPSGSRLRRASPLGSRDYLASAGFPHGARSPSLFQPMALCMCRRPLPRRAVLSQIGSRAPAVFAVIVAARHPEYN